MALKPCVECNTPISDKAKSCPNCGAKNKKKTSFFMIFMLFMVGVGVLSAMTSGEVDVNNIEAPEKKPSIQPSRLLMVIAEEELKKTAKDESSLKFRNPIYVDESIHGAAACGAVNGKNSFGGYVGWKGFVITEHNPVVIIQSASNTNEFAKLWNEVCVTKNQETT